MFALSTLSLQIFKFKHFYTKNMDAGICRYKYFTSDINEDENENKCFCKIVVFNFWRIQHLQILCLYHVLFRVN